MRFHIGVCLCNHLHNVDGEQATVPIPWATLPTLSPHPSPRAHVWIRTDLTRCGIADSCPFSSSSDIIRDLLEEEEAWEAAHK